MKNFEGPLGIFGTLFGLFTYLVGDHETLSQDQKDWVFVIFSVILLAIVISIYSSDRKKIIKVRYAEAIPGLSTAISKFINNFKEKKIILSSKILADDMSRIYTEIKNVKCCITIKIITKNYKVITIRASNFKGRKNREGEDQTEETFKDILRLNSDVEVLFDEDEINNYFFSNNLTSKDGYKNTRIPKDYYDKINEENHLPKWIKKMKNEWPLPYKSTIVVPLRLMDSNESSPITSGILCIDSDKKRVFDREIDVSILQTIAETLHLSYKSEIKNKPTKGTI